MSYYRRYSFFIHRFSNAAKVVNKRIPRGFQPTKCPLRQDFNLLYKDCEAARQIPRWETHIFSSDRYEMSKEEYDQLIELLDIIAEERPKIIANKIDLLTENAEKAQETYSKLCNIENAWQNINDCLEQYKKITKEL